MAIPAFGGFPYLIVPSQRKQTFLFQLGWPWCSSMACSKIHHLKMFFSIWTASKTWRRTGSTGLFHSRSNHGSQGSLFNSLAVPQDFLPSGNLTVCNWKWPFIVDLPIENGGSFHSFLYVYQRVFFLSNGFWTLLGWHPLPIPQWWPCAQEAGEQPGGWIRSNIMDKWG